MPRPLFPNDYIHAHGYRQELQVNPTVVLERDFATHASAALDVVAVSDFGDIAIDGGVIYEISAGPFLLVNGQIADTTTARDGAVARLRFTYNDIGGSTGNPLGQPFDFTLRRANPTNLQVPKITTHFYTTANATVRFGLTFGHGGGVAIPGGDMTNPMPAPKNSTAANTDATTTELKDSMGDLTFTAKTGRQYRITYGAKVGFASGTNHVMGIRVRDGGGSSPTNTSTILTDQQVFMAVSGGNGQFRFTSTQVVTGLSAGTHTIAPFYYRAVGANGVQPTGNETRQFVVQDVTEADALTDGKIQLATYGYYVPTLLSVRPVAEATAVNIINLTT